MAMFTTQPSKAIYTLGALSFELARLPLFAVKYLSSHGRQHASWTFRQAIAVRVLFSALYHLATVQVHTPLPLTPGREKERFVRIKPAASEHYQGPLRSNKDVVPTEIGATWYPAPLTATGSDDKRNIKVLLHVHGGAFAIGDGRTASSGYAMKKLLKHATATHALCPQYRLSTLPVSPTSNPFPAALQDTLTTYLYLLHDLNIAPKDIILSGDSAGGNLCIALLRYLADHAALPHPSATLLWSPWIDPSDTSASYVYDNANFATDYLSPPFTYWGTSAYAGPAGTGVLSSPYISQKDRTFRTAVPIWVNVGSKEILFRDIVDWAGSMKEAGNAVVLDVEENVPHDILYMGNVLGFDDQVEGMARRAGVWLRERGGL
ncbi:alpha/beta-hydrolase [Decorospora gaudefroyi]|uniref:Alpha/beta-hydrolase n=1 Tax=Decorospora gaudefroyi TaxID=184978 RepID=A0A6A5KE28_9PLEO|nr:alpha/beta-hydrolase [Decorospora gaudefroyi]